MRTNRSPRILTIVTLAALASSAWSQPTAVRTLPANDVAALRCAEDPQLGAMRAGGVPTVAKVTDTERSELAAAQLQAPTLDAMRAGDGPSTNEWNWLIIGAAVVLLIVLL